MNERKKFKEHLAKIMFSQNNQEYRNFLIGILRMEKFENWENILQNCQNNYDFDLPCMTYDYKKYVEQIKQYCSDEFNMSDSDFYKKEPVDPNTREESILPVDYEKSNPEQKTIIRQNYNVYRINKEWIGENLDFVLSEELPDLSKEEIETIKQRTLELQNINESTFKNVNFKMLQDKYLKVFNKQQMAQIVSYPVIQDVILNLDDNELECLDVAVKDYIEREKFLFRSDEKNFDELGTSQWTQMTEKYLVSLVSGQYTDIIDEIGKVEDDNQRKELFKQLSYIMCDANVYEISTIEQLENFEKIQQEVCKKIIYDEDINNYPQLANMHEVTRKRFAVMQRFGISSGLELSRMFDDDISTIQVKQNSTEESQIEYLLAIKELYEKNSPEELKEIFELLEEASQPYIPQKYNNQKILEKKLKLLYEKTYNKSLTKIETLEEISDERRYELGLDDYEGKVVEVGDNFNLTVTSISPYADKSRKIDNFAQDWQRRDLKSQHACFSNITAERFKTATVPFVLLGFGRLHGIDMQAPIDNMSEGMAMTPFCECNWFTMPGNNGLGKFNTVTEIDAKRIMPSYIPVKKQNGKLVEIENAKMASKQFQEMNGSEEPLTLVIIDEDRLLYRQSLRTLGLIQQYRKTQDNNLLREIAGCLGDGEGMPGVIYDDILEDIVTQDFSNTEKLAMTCDLSKIVEYINNLPYANETNKKVQLDNATNEIGEDILLEMYQEVPPSCKHSVFQTIKRTLDREHAIENSGGEKNDNL